MRGRKNKKKQREEERRPRERGEMRRGLVQASSRKALDEWEEEGPRAAKKIHIKVKRGKPDGVTRTKGQATGKGRGGKTRGRRTQRGRKRSARYEFARFIPPPVFKLRPDVFPPPAFLSALRFLLYRRDRTLSASQLAILPSKQRTQRNARTVYIEKIENYTSIW